jgi:tol-pal system protein YbgF
MRLLAALVLVAALPWAALPARGETLADLRAELGALGAELAALRSELVATGSLAQVGGATALARMDAIEAALVRLTARAEELEIRVGRIVADGTNRLADLEFRIVELEGGDPAQLGTPPPLGGGGAPGGTTTASGAIPSEQASLDRAREVLGQGDFRAAAELLAAHAAAFPAGPLTGEAHFLRGEALERQDDTPGAARAYLESFSGFPDGPRAADALLRLGLALARLGQGPEACITLAEVGVRYPGSAAAGAALAAMPGLNCG